MYTYALWLVSAFKLFYLVAVCYGFIICSVNCQFVVLLAYVCIIDLAINVLCVEKHLKMMLSPPIYIFKLYLPTIDYIDLFAAFSVLCKYKVIAAFRWI